MVVAPEQVDDSEKLTRYIFDKKKIGVNPPKAKRKSFMPCLNKELNRLETSVFRSTYILSEEEAWRIGDEFAGLDKRTTKAKAVILTKVVREEKLNVVSDVSSHPLHAAITNWPTEKDIQIIKALALASGADLNIR